MSYVGFPEALIEERSENEAIQQKRINSVLKEHEASASAADSTRRPGVAEEASTVRKPGLVAWRYLTRYGSVKSRRRTAISSVSLAKPSSTEPNPQKYGCPTLHVMLVIEVDVFIHKPTYPIYIGSPASTMPDQQLTNGNIITTMSVTLYSITPFCKYLFPIYAPSEVVGPDRLFE
jgi:hypothetical protein